MHKIQWLLLLLLFSNFLFAQTAEQDKVSLYFIPTFQEQHLKLAEDVAYQVTNVPSIETFRAYISGVRLLYEGKEVWAEENSYHLLDASEAESMRIDLIIAKSIRFDQVDFFVGIDSLTNVSGVMGGDLDPIKGMYWAWNTGYINFKLEGKCASVPSPRKTFEFHIGGYLPPYQTLQTVSIRTQERETIKVKVALDQFLNAIDLSKSYKVMSPGEEAQHLSTLLTKMFSCDE